MLKGKDPQGKIWGEIMSLFATNDLESLAVVHQKLNRSRALQRTREPYTPLPSQNKI